MSLVLTTELPWCVVRHGRACRSAPRLSYSVQSRDWCCWGRSYGGSPSGEGLRRRANLAPLLAARAMSPSNGEIEGPGAHPNGMAHNLPAPEAPTYGRFADPSTILLDG